LFHVGQLLHDNPLWQQKAAAFKKPAIAGWLTLVEAD
jgi:hypothetical protein